MSRSLAQKYQEKQQGWSPALPIPVLLFIHPLIHLSTHSLTHSLSYVLSKYLAHAPH